MTTLNILILEDEHAVAEMLRSHIGNAFADVLPLVARSIAEANILTYQYEFAAHVVNLTLPDGPGADFISDVRTVLPDSNFIALTNASPDEGRQQLARIGNIPVMSKPLDLPEITSLLGNFLPRAEAAEFRGSFRSLRLVDLIQVKCVGLDTCRVLIYNPEGGAGIIGFQRGALVHATVQAAGGVLAGRDAFNEIFRWKNGSFHEQEFDSAMCRNITDPWELVLLDAVRLSDELNSLEVA